MELRIQLTAESKYQLLLQIAQKVRDTLDLDEILNHLLDMVQTVIDYDAGGIFVLSEDLVTPTGVQPRQLIAGIARRGFDEHPVESDAMLMLGQGIVGHVIRTGEVVVAPDVRRDPRYVVGRERTRAEIAAPILQGERAIGALNLESDRVGAYDAGAVEVLRFFADAAAISIEKAMLHRRILAQRHVAEQLELAHKIQARLLPQSTPHVPGYELAGVCRAAFDIGGDYFDYIPLDDGRLGLTIADVSGHGIPAALIMSAFRALLRTQVQREARPAQVAATMNRWLPDFTGGADFVTAVYGVLDPATGDFIYSNCGHNPPLLFRAAGAPTALTVGGPALSVVGHLPYAAETVALAPGDLLLLYTDGVVELTNGEGEEFGVARLETAVRGAHSRPLPALIDAIVAQTQAFAGSAHLLDDFTLLLVRRAA
jgi:phosphoserine phosphatase RsbU/P